jgi:hypothetical protein
MFKCHHITPKPEHLTMYEQSFNSLFRASAVHKAMANLQAFSFDHSTFASDSYSYGSFLPVVLRPSVLTFVLFSSTTLHMLPTRSFSLICRSCCWFSGNYNVRKRKNAEQKHRGGMIQSSNVVLITRLSFCSEY